MSRIAIVPATQTLASAQNVIRKGEAETLAFEIHHVTDFMGVWYKISRDPVGECPFDGVASPIITRGLKALGVEIGEEVIVARRPNIFYDQPVHVVSPLTPTNRHLLGEFVFDTPASQPSLLAG